MYLDSWPWQRARDHAVHKDWCKQMWSVQGDAVSLYKCCAARLDAQMFSLHMMILRF